MILIIFIISFDLPNLSSSMLLYSKHILALTLLMLMAFLSHSQNIPMSFSGTAEYIKGSTLDTSFITKVEAHLRNLNQEDVDSLAPTVFKAIEDQIDKHPPGFQAYLYETLLISGYQLLGNIPLCLHYLEKQIEALKISRNSSPLARAYSQKMFLLADTDSTNLAFETSLEVRKLLEKEEDPRLKGFLYRQLAAFYHRTADAGRAIKICNEGIEFILHENEVFFLGSLYETLALSKKQGNTPITEIIDIRREAIKYALLNKDTFNLRTIYRNLARSFESLEEADSAQKYFALTFEIYKRYPYFFGWVGDQVSYAEFLINQGKTEEASQIIDTLHIIYEKAPDHSLSLTMLYNLSLKYNARTNNYEGFLESFDSWSSLLVTQYEEDKLKAREEMAAKYEAEKKEAENEILTAKNQSKRTGLWALTGALVLLIILVILIVEKRKGDRKIHQQKEGLLQLELKNTLLEKEQINARSIELKNDLQQRIKQVIAQQMINSDLMEMIEELRSLEESPLVKKKTAQMKIKLNEQLSVQVFDEIYNKMKGLYPELLLHLKNKIGSDKEYEIISTAMYFMGYETKDIAKILQRTDKAVRNMRYRARKKLELSDHEDLIEHLNNKHSALA